MLFVFTYYLTHSRTHNRPDTMMLWSQTSSLTDLAASGRWWADTPEAEWPEGSIDDIKKDIAQNGDTGDRRQELVFMGMNLDAEAIERKLDACLLSDAELAEGPGQWIKLHDPLP